MTSAVQSSDIFVTVSRCRPGCISADTGAESRSTTAFLPVSEWRPSARHRLLPTGTAGWSGPDGVQIQQLAVLSATYQGAGEYLLCVRSSNEAECIALSEFSGLRKSVARIQRQAAADSS